MTASGEHSKLGDQPSSSSATASPEHEAYRNEGYQAGAVSPTSEPGYTDSVEHDVSFTCTVIIVNDLIMADRGITSLGLVNRRHCGKYILKKHYGQVVFSLT